MPDVIYHHAYAVDPRVVAELTKLVATMLGSGDGRPLQDYRDARLLERGRVRDAVAMPLDEKALRRVIEQIRTLEDSELKGAPEVKALLDTAYGTSLRARDVSKEAFDGLLRSAPRLARFVELDAPEYPTLKEVELTHARLLAMDQFDLTTRMNPPTEDLDPDLLMSCLAVAAVRELDRIYRVTSYNMALLGGAPLFPPPSGEAALTNWKRFAEGIPQRRPPHVVSGAELRDGISKVDEARARLREVDGKVSVATGRVVSDMGEAMDRYRALAVAASERGLAVMEWVYSETDVDDT